MPQSVLHLRGNMNEVHAVQTRQPHFGMYVAPPRPDTAGVRFDFTGLCPERAAPRTRDGQQPEIDQEPAHQLKYCHNSMAQPFSKTIWIDLF
jgi:hypothetical protein